MDKLLELCTKHLRMLGYLSREDVEDLAMELWIKLQGKEILSEQYIVRAAKNKATEFIRSRCSTEGRKTVSYSRPGSIDESYMAGPNDVESEFLEAYDVYEQALSMLSPKYEAVVRCRVAGMSFKEISEYLGRTLPCVKSQYHRAKKEMRPFFEKTSTNDTF